METMPPLTARYSQRWARTRASMQAWMRGPGNTIAGEPLRRFVLVSLFFTVLSIAMVVLAVDRGPQMSITDEPAHAGYLYDIAFGHIPGPGSLLPKEIKYESYCHDLAGNTGSVVCTGYGSSGYGAGQQIYTFGDPPVYYAVTGLLDRAVSGLIPGTHNFITVGRDLGALWLCGAMIVLYLAVRRFRVAWPYALAAASLVPLCPGILASTSQITSDAPAALCGALSLYMLARLTVEKNHGLVAPFIVTVLTTGTKILNGLPMLIVGAIALIMAGQALWKRERRTALRLGYVAAAVFAGFLGTYAGWSAYQSGRGDPNWVNPNAGNGLQLTGSKIGDYASNTFGIFGHLTTNYWLQPQISGESVVIWATLLGVLLAAAPLMAMVATRSRTAGWILGIGTFAGISVVTFAVQTQVYMANHEYFAVVAPRYALTFLPWAIACLVLVASRRKLLRTTSLLVTLGLGVMLLAEAGLVSLGPALTSTGRYLVG